MNKLVIALLVSCGCVFAQSSGPSVGSPINSINVTIDPSGSCSSYQQKRVNVTVDPPREWLCVNTAPLVNAFGTWTHSNPGSGATIATTPNVLAGDNSGNGVSAGFTTGSVSTAITQAGTALQPGVGTTVNGQSCVIGSTCTVTAAPSGSVTGTALAGGSSAPSNFNLTPNAVTGAVTYPMTLTGTSTSSGNQGFDWYTNSYTDAVDNNGAGSAQYIAPTTQYGHNRNSSLAPQHNFFIETTMQGLAGTSPWFFNVGKTDLFLKRAWPPSASDIANTSVVVAPGPSAAGNHAPQNVITMSCDGFGDTCHEIDADGGMIHGMFIRTAASGTGVNPNIFPVWGANITTTGATSDTIPLELDVAGIPGILFGIYSTGASQNQLFKINGPLNAPGGTLTADAAYADVFMHGNVNTGGPTLTVDQGSGSTNATLTLNGRNAGTANTGHVIVDQNGGLLMDSKSGNPITFKPGGTTAAGYAQSGTRWSVVTTVASASTIAVASEVLFVTGTTPINTITSPSGCNTSTQDCFLTIIWDPATGPASLTSAGNIYAPIQGFLGTNVNLKYNPATTKWYPDAGSTQVYTFSTLPSPTANGKLVYCSDCNNFTDDTTGTFDSAAASGGHGTNVLRENGAWRVH